MRIEFSAWLAVGLAVGLLLLSMVVYKMTVPRGVPRIHDVTTDLDDPPVFRSPVDPPNPARRHRPYPHGGAEVPSLQRKAYPDLAPLRVTLASEVAFQHALDTARELGWKVLWSDAEQGRIEATATSRWFRFVDDVAMRVRPTSGGSVVDLRSISRIGFSDLGANAARVRRFTERFESRVASGQASAAAELREPRRDSKP